MITYRLNEFGTYALKIVDDVSTGIWCNVETHEEYLEWLAEGNEPLPADQPDAE